MTADLRKKIITDNLDVVKWSIYYNIQVNEQVQGLSYDDLYQVGCLALCEASLSYDGSTKFKTYAGVVVRNRLIDHCRKIKRLQGRTCYLGNQVKETDDADYNNLIADPLEAPEEKIYTDEIYSLMQRVKQKYSGITLKGIEAIELKIKGYSGVEIAELYGVKPNLLGAWITKAKKKLREDTDFLTAFPDRC